MPEVKRDVEVVSLKDSDANVYVIPKELLQQYKIPHAEQRDATQLIKDIPTVGFSTLRKGSPLSVVF